MTRHKPTSSRDMADILVRYAAGTGLDIRSIIAKTGLRSFPGESGNGRIPIAQLIVLWQEVIRQSGDPNFGLHVGMAAGKMYSGGILLSIMTNCATLESALEKLTRYHNLQTDYVQLRLHHDGEFTRYAWETNDRHLQPERHYTEMVFCQLHTLLRRLTQDAVQPLAIHFRHAPPTDIHEHQDIFGCTLVFDCPQNELVLRRPDLARPIFLANAALLAKLEHIADEMLAQIYPPDSWAEKVTHLIDVCLWKGEKPALAELAAELAVSPRQLQNKLNQEGLTYQGILDEVRKETALRYLGDRHSSICEIAFLLGYREQSTFNHAFKRWTGKSPGEYRSALQEQEGCGLLSLEQTK